MTLEQVHLWLQFAAVQAVLCNWRNEFAKWAPDMKVVMYDGGQEERKAIRAAHLDTAQDFNVLITHYDLVIRDKTFLKKVKNGCRSAIALRMLEAQHVSVAVMTFTLRES